MRRVSYLALAGALALSACGGHATSALPPAPVTSQKQAEPVAFTMHWPGSGVTGGRRPHFVSPSTMSVVVEINNDPTLTTIANNPGGGSSTVSLKAPVGSDDFIISLYDQPQQTGETTAVGNELGQVELVQNIEAGKTNTLSATVNGIAASLSVVPVPGQAFVQTGGTAAQPSYTIVGENVATFSVTPLDADGNAIVGTGITPTVSLHASAKTDNLLVVPVSGDNSRFTVQPDAPASATGPSVIAQATDAMGDTASLTVPISEISEVYVSYPGASGAKIAAYDSSGNAIALPSGAFAGLQNPVAMAYDDTFNELLVADAGLGEVLAFDSLGNPKSGFTPIALASVNSVAVDPVRGHVVATSDSTGIIANTKNGLPSGDTAVVSPFSITTGAGVSYFPQLPNMWNGDELLIGNASLQELDIYSAYGVPTIWWPPSYSLSPAGTSSGIANDGLAVYATGSAGGTGTIWEIAINGGTNTSVTDAGGPAGIAHDVLTGDFFVAESAGNAIDAYAPGLTADPAHTFATPASSGLSAPQGIAVAY